MEKIAKRISRARNASINRASTLDEIRAISKYLYRRMKAIVCTIISSGISLGALDYLQWDDSRSYLCSFALCTPSSLLVWNFAPHVKHLYFLPKPKKFILTNC